jgi:hypothetical protein
VAYLADKDKSKWLNSVGHSCQFAKIINFGGDFGNVACKIIEQQTNARRVAAAKPDIVVEPYPWPFGFGSRRCALYIRTSQP